MASLNMVFRDPTDLGKVRQKSTPSSTVLLNNIEKFENNWGNIKLKKHIMSGCLSGIQPGRGTNRNENLDKNINSIMDASKYGVDLAHALLTTCLHKHNTKGQKQTHYACSEVLEDVNQETFGLACGNDMIESQSTKGTATLDKLNFITSGATLLLNRMSSDEVKTMCNEINTGTPHMALLSNCSIGVVPLNN